MNPRCASSSIEFLESRITPAGNVIAELIGGHLFVTGDAEANALELIQTAPSSETTATYQLAPADENTTINGVAEPVSISGITGDVRFSLGGGNDVVRLGNDTEPVLRFLRDLKVNGGAGDDTIEFGPASIFVARHLQIAGKDGADRVEALRFLGVDGDASIALGAGDNTALLNGVVFGGNARLSSGPGGEMIATISSATIYGAMTIDATTAVSARITVGASEVQNGFDSTMFGGLRILTGHGADEIAVSGVEIDGALSIASGKGADTILIDDDFVADAFTLSTSSGADVVKIELREGSGSPADFGAVSVDLGAGADVLRLGRAGSVANSVQVFGASRWVGGAGADRLDLANLDTHRAEPSFAGFERFGAPPLFGKPKSYAIGSPEDGVYMRNIVSADLNGDERLDLVMADEDRGALVVLFGDEKGEFLPPVFIDAGVRPLGLEVGDFDGKNGLDLAVANGTERVVSVLLNDGLGVFGPRTTFAVGTLEHPPTRVEVADFNGDAKLDLATLNISDYQASSVSILLGAGDGTFTFREEFELTGANIDYFGSPNDLALGDLNGDGKLDLAATGLRGFGVLLGNGDGTFAVRVEKRDIGGGIELADMNRDGKLDLLINDSGLDLQLGNGDGTFQPPVNISQFGSGDPITADFDKDGFLDVAVTRPHFSDDLLEVLLGKGDGTFQQPLAFELGGDAGPLATGDFNRDGFPDLAVGNPYAATLSLLLNRATA